MVVIPNTLKVKGTAPLVPPTLSVAVTLKLIGPPDAGVPCSNPDTFKLSPLLGSPVADQVYGGTPLPAANCCE